jgi:putative two-component system response regulator
MALADVYDALTTRRAYKDAIPHDAAVAIIIEGAGRHFDPDVVGAFADIADEFEVIACRYSD